MRLRISLNRDELNALQYPVVVEMWDKKRFGRIKRAYNNEFNENERRKARDLYSLFYTWYLIKGTPENHVFKPETIAFINRLINFFGTV